MNNLSNRITEVLDLKDKASNGIVCLTDIKSGDNVHHVYVTANKHYISFHCGEYTLNAFNEKESELNKEEILLIDIMTNNIMICVPTLFGGIAQKISSFIKPNNEPVLESPELDFNKNDFISMDSSKATLVAKLEGTDYRNIFVFEKNSDSHSAQVNEFGIDRSGEELIFNAQVDNTLEIDGYLILETSYEPLFIEKSKLNEAYKDRCLILPCVCYRDNDSNLIDIVVLANKLDGEL